MEIGSRIGESSTHLIGRKWSNLMSGGGGRAAGGGIQPLGDGPLVCATSSQFAGTTDDWNVCVGNTPVKTLSLSLSLKLYEAAGFNGGIQGKRGQPALVVDRNHRTKTIALNLRLSRWATGVRISRNLLKRRRKIHVIFYWHEPILLLYVNL